VVGCFVEVLRGFLEYVFLGFGPTLGLGIV